MERSEFDTVFKERNVKNVHKYDQIHICIANMLGKRYTFVDGYKRRGNVGRFTNLLKKSKSYRNHIFEKSLQLN